MKSRNLILAGAVGAFVLCSCAGRRPPEPGPAERETRAQPSSVGLAFAKFDADGDKEITQAELRAGIDLLFAEADTDHNGELTPFEFQAFSIAHLGGVSSPPYRLDFDRNVDGRITLEEFRTELLARGADLDANKDSVLSYSELMKASGQPAKQPDEKERKKLNNQKVKR